MSTESIVEKHKADSSKVVRLFSAEAEEIARVRALIHWLRNVPSDEVIAIVTCPRCKAPVNTPCNMKTKSRRYHTARADRFFTMRNKCPTWLSHELRLYEQGAHTRFSAPFECEPKSIAAALAKSKFYLALRTAGHTPPFEVQ